jgi:hypothetical protein
MVEENVLREIEEVLDSMPFLVRTDHWDNPAGIDWSFKRQQDLSREDQYLVRITHRNNFRVFLDKRVCVSFNDFLDGLLPEEQLAFLFHINLWDNTATAN